MVCYLFIATSSPTFIHRDTFRFVRGDASSAGVLDQVRDELKEELEAATTPPPSTPVTSDEEASLDGLTGDRIPKMEQQQGQINGSAVKRRLEGDPTDLNMQKPGSAKRVCREGWEQATPAAKGEFRSTY